MSSLNQHHAIIRQFLKDVRDNTPELSSVPLDGKERKLLDYVIDADVKRLKQAEAAEKLGVKEYELRRVIQKSLNEALRTFSASDKCKIHPPIQLYFNNAGKYPGGHLACCKLPENQSKSQDFILVKDLESMIENARQKLCLITGATGKDCSLELYIPPSPEKKDSERKIHNFFRFEHQWTEFTGREEEKKRLYKFINYPNENLLWWVITGKGGIGKSRLALELCIELQNDWHVGFLTNTMQLDNLSDWSPSKPTLIVIDYSYGEAKKIGEYFRQLYTKRKNWKYQVRLLFLDRNERSEALKQFRCNDSLISEDMHYGNIKDAKEEASLILKGLNDKSIVQIIDEIFKKNKGRSASKKEEENIKKLLGSEIYNNNPLYTMIITNICAEMGSVNYSNKEHVLDEVLRHYERMWNEAKVNENDSEHKKYINLLVLTTKISGVLKDDYAEYLQAKSDSVDILPQMSNFCDWIYEVLCDNKSNKKLHPFSPDILGEYFVLGCWKKNRYVMKILTKIAWEYESWSLNNFIIRSVEDFPENEMIDEIVSVIGLDGSFDYRKSVLLFGLVSYYSNSGDIEKAEKYFNTIEQLWVKNKQNTHISIQLARAGLHLMKNYKNIDKAIRFYSRLKRNLRNCKENKFVSIQLVKAEFCLIFKYGELGEIGDAPDFLNQIHLTWKKYHPKDRHISCVFAKAGFRLVDSSTSKGEIEIAEEARDRINELKGISISGNINEFGRLYTANGFIADRLEKASYIIDKYYKNTPIPPLELS